MIFSILAAAIINNQNLRALPPRMATPAAVMVKQKNAKLEGNISSIGTNSFMINGTTINLATNTILLRRFGAKSSLSEFSVNDKVSVVGKWTDDTTTILNARLVRNLSIQKRHATFVGTVQSISATGFVLQPVQRPVQLVTVTTKTRYVDRREKAISFSAIEAGQKVKVSGLWDSALNTVTNVELVKDYALPASPSGLIKKPGTQIQTQEMSQ